MGLALSGQLLAKDGMSDAQRAHLISVYQSALDQRAAAPKLTAAEQESLSRLLDAHDPRQYQGIGRYRGWQLVTLPFIREKYEACRDYCRERNHQLMRWSSLSQDSDDREDFALRRGMCSP